MTTVQRTLAMSSFDAYLAECSHPGEYAVSDEASRNELIKRFPFSVMLKVSYPELDFANRWCWQRFGPNDGECYQAQSEYRVCLESEPHEHSGIWTSHWFEKTDYDFGFNEWYFSSIEDRDLFIAVLDEINWGENYAK
ncbi:MAG: hypothetical protein K2X55_26870 [Burkholderiaceae bacterium]|nr:hypothetical protein [Burkholderiaceae bacterium]